MKQIRLFVQRYPYRGLFAWATVCVWAFFFAEILWHLSAFVRRYDLIEIPLVLPYVPLAFVLDPESALVNHRHAFFIALANWFGIFLLGAALCRKRTSAVVSGTGVLLPVLVLAFGRAIVRWVIFPPGPVP